MMSYGAPFVEVEPLADEQERFLSGEERLTRPGYILVSRVPMMMRVR